MSKHVLPATELDEDRVVWILPATWLKNGAHEGNRLRLDKVKGELVELFEEEVLPERIDNPNANRVINRHAQLSLTRVEAEWLRDSLVELLAMGDDW